MKLHITLNQFAYKVSVSGAAPATGGRKTASATVAAPAGPRVQARALEPAAGFVGLEAEALANEKLVQASSMAELGIGGRGALVPRGGLGLMLQRRETEALDLAWRIKAELTKEYWWGPLKVRAATMSVEELAIHARSLPVEGVRDIPTPALQNIVFQWLLDARVPRVSGLGMSGGGGPAAGGPPSPLGRTLGSAAAFLASIPTSVTLGNPERLGATADTKGFTLAHEGTALKLSAGIEWDRLFQAKAAYRGLEFSASAKVLEPQKQEVKLGLQYGPDIPDLKEAGEKFQGVGTAFGDAIVNVPHLVGYLQEKGIGPLAGVPDAVEQAKKIAGERDRTLPVTFGIEAKASRDADSPPSFSVTGNLSLRWDLLKKALPGASPAADDDRMPPLPQGDGRPLGSALQDRMERLFGRALPDIRVHTGPGAASAAAQLGAEAFTLGRDVYFGAGKYAPDSRDGLGLLGHELTHVLQQDDRRTTGARRAGGGDTDTLEREAEAAAQAITTSSGSVHGDALVIDDYHRTHRVADGEPLTLAERAVLDQIATRGRDVCEEVLRAEHPDLLGGERKLLRMTFDLDLSAIVPEAAAQAWGRKMAETIAGALQSREAPPSATPQPGVLLMSPDGKTPPTAAAPTPAPAPGVTPPSPPVPMSEEDQQRIAGIITATPAEKELVRKLSIRTDVKKLQAEVDKLETYQNVTPDDPTAGQNNKRIAEANKRVIRERLDSVGLNAIEELEPLAAQLMGTFQKKGYDLTLFMLDENAKIAKKEMGRYLPSQGADPASDIRKLKDAAADIAKKQAPLIARLKELEAQRATAAASQSPIGNKAGPLPQPIDASNVEEKATGPLGKDDPKVQELWPAYLNAKETQGGTFSVLMVRGLDYGALAAADPKQIESIVTGQAEEVLRNIQRTKNDMTAEKVWELPAVIAQTKGVLGIRPGEGADDAVQEHLKGKAIDNALWNAITAAAAIALGIVATAATGGLAVLALVGSGVLSAYSAAKHIGEYGFGQAAYGSALDPTAAIAQEEPSLFWLAVDLIGAGLDIGAAAMAFKNLARAAKAAMQTEQALKELEEVARRQYRALAGQGKLGLTEEAFVKKLLESARKGGSGEAAIKQLKIVREIVEGTSPRVIRLLNKDQAALQELVKEHGNWKSLVESLVHGGPDAEKVAKNLGEFRSNVVKDLEQFGAKPVGGASSEPISDVDLNVVGENAGATVLKLEQKMVERFGAGWSEALHMNFYTEAGRLVQYEQIMQTLSPAARQALQARITQLTEKFTFAKMLEHAGQDKEAIKRVEELIKGSGRRYNLDELRALSNVDQAKRRGELLAKIDDEVKVFNQLKQGDTPGRAKQAQKITELQMEANFYSKEAYIGPGAGRMTVQGIAVKGHEAYQAALSNLDMIEHFIAGANGDAARACREYEFFKYVNRYAQAARSAGVQSQELKYFESLSEYVYKQSRGLHAKTAHLSPPGATLKPGSGVPDMASGEPVTDEFLRQQFGLFQKEVRSTLPRIQRAAQAQPGAWTPSPLRADIRMQPPAAGMPPPEVKAGTP